MVIEKPECLKLSVVIVSYNSLDTILQAVEPLHSLYVEDYLRVIVVDNHRGDGVADLLEEKCSWVTVKQPGENLGFGAGCNAGFKSGRSEYTLFLNPDATITPDSVRELVDFLDENPRIAITAPAIYEGTALQEAGLTHVPILTRIFQRDMKPQVKNIRPNETAFKTNWLCGSILLIRSAIFRELGGFDERFFLYFEETDLCKRVLESGNEIWANGMVVAEHVGGASSKDANVDYISGCVAEHYYRSRYYFFKKHYGLFAAASNEVLELIQIFLAALKKLLLGRKNALNAFKIRIRSPFFSEP